MQVFVVEAHPDDAALSIGGLLLNLRNSSQTIVITVFSGSWAKRSFKKPYSIEDIRQLENQRALNFANAENICLEFPEAHTRGYKKCRRAKIPSKEKTLLRKVSLSIEQILGKRDKPSLVLFPIAVGEHIDHLITFESMIQLYQQGTINAEQTRPYEDCPYVCGSENDLSKRLNIIKMNYFQVTPLMIDITSNLKQKSDMLKSFTSQFRLKKIRKVKTYSFDLGKEVNEENQAFYERIWAPNLIYSSIKS